MPNNAYTFDPEKSLILKEMPVLYPCVWGLKDGLILLGAPDETVSFHKWYGEAGEDSPWKVGEWRRRTLKELLEEEDAE